MARRTSKTNAEGGSRTAGRRRKGAALEGGLRFERRFTRAGADPLDEIEWETRNALITNERGETVFEQKNVEIPKSWTMTATNVVVSKYFRGNLGTPERERSVRQLMSRVADTITRWGGEGGYFASTGDRDVFHDELMHLMVNQKMAFNSPVWFNVGVVEKPQCSACFINSVSDSMDSILELAKTEGMLFKWGSGTGSNLSRIRSSREKLRGGGTASGPVSFMKGYDAFAGVIKSGGKTRRAAKMVILDVDHPDVMEFIRSKEIEEKKAWALIEAGYDGGFNVPGGAYDSVFYQNANHSVRATDEFMGAVERDGDWTTHNVLDGKPADTYPAREMLRAIAEATHVCGDPGMQFDTTVNRWHTCKSTDRIYASNPCSEYMFLDDTACNLASLNLKKFVDPGGRFDVAAFGHAVDVTITAMEILVGNASYPTPKITENSLRFRPLGLGYANLGALLMSWGLPYDSDQGRSVAAALTALMCGQAYATSARIAAQLGPFEEYGRNEASMLEVIDMHRRAVEDVDAKAVPTEILAAARESWTRARTLGGEYGFRNSQATVLAPTGTIGFLMDCDTTGVEPELALIKYKKLVGGGMMKIVNQTVESALERLGYTPAERSRILEAIEETGTIEGAPGLREEHLPVFDCSFTPAGGTRSIHYMGHLRMMAAVQPFLSGAISKTVNLPSPVTVDEIADAYLAAWKLGLKAVALYRDGSKRTQPLSTRKDAGKTVETSAAGALADVTPRAYRRRLPDERQAITHKFSIGGHEGYLTVGMYEDGAPGEIFVVMSKEGSVVSGLMDGFATAISMALQYGVPLHVLVNKFSHMRFEPSGFTNNQEIPIAKSILDYIFRWLASRFLSDADQAQVGIQKRDWGVEDTEDEAKSPESGAGAAGGPETEAAPNGNGTNGANGHTGTDTETTFAFVLQEDAPPCHECGTIMVRSGSCYKCLNCGATSGCS
jgi:ribonucleoside-diphosphate reductase alpha chain